MFVIDFNFASIVGMLNLPNAKTLLENAEFTAGKFEVLVLNGVNYNYIICSLQV
jgi:hypothetical protein